MATPSISVCLISGAEAQRIASALKSVAEWTQEIILVLNEEVEDETETIAREFGAKVFREKWKGHVEQKNSASNKAAGDWILAIDEDEVVSSELRKEIEILFQTPGRLAPYTGFSFPRCSYYCGRWIRHGDWYPDRKLRLWRRGQARWQGINPHDEVAAEGRIGKLRGQLLHYGTGTIEDQMKKMVTYADIFTQGYICGERRVSYFDLLFRPLWRFVRGFFFKLGFLDGWQGLTISWMTTFYTFLRYFKAFEAQHQARNLKTSTPSKERVELPASHNIERK